MRVLTTLGLCLVLTSAVTGAAGATEVNRRMDCRFHGTNGEAPRFCYASALYHTRFQRGEFRYDSIRYNVGCDRQTVFEDVGVIQSQDLLGERIRPEVAAAPLIEVEEEGALARAGNYTAKLQLESGAVFLGHCYVADVSENGDQPRLNDPIHE